MAEEQQAIFNEKLINLVRAIHQTKMLSRRRVSPLQDSSHGQGRILPILKLQPEMISKDLRYLLGIHPQSLNQSLKRLEEEGYITRHPAENDRRVTMVTLTDKGKAVKSISAATSNNNVLAGFNDDELQQFGDYVDRLSAAYEQQISSLATPAEKERLAKMKGILSMALHDQQIYNPDDPTILEKQTAAQLPMYEYNRTLPTEGEKRQKILKRMLGKVGTGCYIEPPFHANFGGQHVMFGDHIYANFNLTVVDDTYIYIGSHTMIGPNVTLASANHPILPELREKGYQYNLPIHIGKNCWLGAGVIVVPGVTIGDNTVVGAGAVVTKDLPANVIAAGVPAKVLRPISDHDRKYYHGQMRIDPQLLSSKHNPTLI